MAAPPPWHVVLRALREVRGVTQEGWAARLGYSRRTLLRWEQGDAVPDAAAEAAIIALCQEERLFRTYDRGPLTGQTVTATGLAELLAAARGGPPRAAAPPVHLPTPLTRFIGREQELAALTALLGTNRLLTLTGAGGSGKTRVAIAAARQVADRFPDGVWFVDLSGVTDPAGVLPVVAQALGVKEREGVPLGEALAAYLHGKHLLLVLDNFEQVVGAALALYDLLLAAPALSVLVTSRVLLRVAGEQEYAVEPLPLPAGTAVAAVAASAAVQLFVQRVHATRPDFTLTGETAPAVAALCRRLDGLPLAIELAAAWVKLLSPAALLTRLEQRLPLLTGGARTLPQRQQTLRNTLQWSWDLLAPAEQDLFRRLGVFASGWTVAAAEAVCNPDGDLDVLTGLAALVDHSLVRQPALNDEPRFSMLATVREFALEQLAVRGEAADLRRAHAAYFCAVAEQADAAAWQTGHWLADLVRPGDVERDNLLGALQWALDQQETELGVRLAAALGIWFFYRAPGEGQRLLTRALRLPGAARWPKACGRMRYATAACAIGQGEMQAAMAQWEEGAADCRAAADVIGLSATLVLLSAAVPTAETARALALADEALAVARATGNQHLLAFVEAHAGYTWLLHTGDVRTARAHLETALALARPIDADWVLVETLSYLGEVAYAQRQLQEAQRLWQEVRPRAEAFGERWYLARAYIYAALLASTQGEDAQAGVAWRDGLTLARELGSAPLLAMCVAGPAGVLSAQGRPELAAQLLGAAESTWRTLEHHELYQSLFREVYAPALAAVSAALREDTLTAARALGQALSLEEAAALTLEALSGVASSPPGDRMFHA